MSIYATLWQIQIPDEDRGGSWSDAWWEVYAQGVPNHINEQNGYAGPAWDDWLPAFQHKAGCVQRVQVYYDRPADDGGVAWIRQSCEPDHPQAERRDYHDCECGLRAVFLCDDLTKKGTARNGQEYVNPVLVLTGVEYESIPFADLLQRIEDAVAERRDRPQCFEPDCTSEAVHTEIRRGTIVKAWCETHDTPKIWRGQQKRRRQAAAAEAGADGGGVKG